MKTKMKRNKFFDFVGMLFFGSVSFFIWGIAIAGLYFCISEFSVLMEALKNAPLSAKIFWISISAACLLIYREAFKFGKECWSLAKALNLKVKYGDLINPYKK